MPVLLVHSKRQGTGICFSYHKADSHERRFKDKRHTVFPVLGKATGQPLPFRGTGSGSGREERLGGLAGDVHHRLLHEPGAVGGADGRCHHAGGKRVGSQVRAGGRGKFHRGGGEPLLQPRLLRGTGRAAGLLRQKAPLLHGGEDKHYTAGKQPLVVSYKGWNIALFICYDLRFPVWSRNTGNRYDMAVYMANWPEARASVWKPLLLARALENQAYVCGVNRTGVDGKGFAYRGGSVVYSPKGETILDAADREEAVETAALSYAGLDTFRTKFPVSNDADTFHIG